MKANWQENQVMHWIGTTNMPAVGDNMGQPQLAQAEGVYGSCSRSKLSQAPSQSTCKFIGRELASHREGKKTLWAQGTSRQRIETPHRLQMAKAQVASSRYQETYVQLGIYMHTYVHTYIRTYVHTYIQT